MGLPHGAGPRTIGDALNPGAFPTSLSDDERRSLVAFLGLPEGTAIMDVLSKHSFRLNADGSWTQLS